MSRFPDEPRTLAIAPADQPPIECYGPSADDADTAIGVGDESTVLNEAKVVLLAVWLLEQYGYRTDNIHKGRDT